MAKDMSGASWWSRTCIWSAVFTIVALAAALFPALGGNAVCSADLAVLTLTLIAVIWYTCFTYESVMYSRWLHEYGQARESQSAMLDVIRRVLIVTTKLKELSARQTSPRHQLSCSLDELRNILNELEWSLPAATVLVHDQEVGESLFDVGRAAMEAGRALDQQIREVPQSAADPNKLFPLEPRAQEHLRAVWDELSSAAIADKSLKGEPHPVPAVLPITHDPSALKNI